MYTGDLKYSNGLQNYPEHHSNKGKTELEEESRLKWFAFFVFEGDLNANFVAVSCPRV